MQISRSFKRHLTAADRRAKVTIEACVATGAGIDFIEEAPSFRYQPIPAIDRELYHGPPSGRGSIPCGRGNPLKLKNWAPSKLNANPQYDVPMKGDSAELTEARNAWAMGDPVPLREYLAELAEERRLRNSLFEEAA